VDPVRFDSLVKSLSTSGTRRGLVQRLAALPLGMSLAALLGAAPGVAAKKKKTQQQDDDHGSSSRRHRRKAEHRHQTGNNKENRKGERKGKTKVQGRKRCKPQSLAQTCAGKCATVIDNCGTPVECGSCVCTPSCPECQTCNERTGACVPAFADDACGDPPTCVGGLATPSGTCDRAGSCQPGSPVACDPLTCDGDICATSCDDDNDCVASTFCDLDTNACVARQAIGADCDRPRQCSSGNCVNEVCCTTSSCGECEACNLGTSLGTCARVPDLTECGDGQVARVCCIGVCSLGNSCGCSGCSQCEACVDGACNAEAADNTVCNDDVALTAYCCGGECVCNFLLEQTCKYSLSGGTCCCSGATQVCCDVDVADGGGTTCKATCPP
jgi:hypothetical protein